MSASSRIRCRSRSSGGDNRGLLGGLPTTFQLLLPLLLLLLLFSLEDEDDFWDWMGRGETRGGVTRPDGLFSMMQKDS